MGGEGQIGGYPFTTGSSVTYNQPKPDPEIRLEYENEGERVVLSIENTDDVSLKQMVLAFHLALRDVINNNGE